MANTEACQEVLDYLLAHPEKHCQRYLARAWDKLKAYLGSGALDAELRVVEKAYPQANVCGTTMCIAGTAMFLQGRLELSNEGYERIDGVQLSGRERWIAEGAKALGLTYDQARSLFMEMDNDKALHMLKEYANGES